MGEEWPKVIRIPTLIYSATIQQQPPDNKHSQGYAEVNLNPVNMLDLGVKEVIVSYGIHSPFVRQMLNWWATKNRIISQGFSFSSVGSWSSITMENLVDRARALEQ